MVTDGQGEPYALNWPCRRTAAGWVSSNKGTLLAPSRQFMEEAMTARRFPTPWRVVEHPESFWVQDASGQTVGWFYFRDHPETAHHAGVLERDEARRMAANSARLPELLGKADRR
jgi:hypothetical protein